MNKKPNKSYDRVMSRVYKDSRSSLKSNPIVTRHESCSSARVSAKPLASNVSSSVFSELPTVLNNYVPETVEKKVVRPSVMSSKVVKPRRTLNSLDTSKSPPRMGRAGKARSLSAQGSVPVVRRDEGWSETHLRECYSSRSHTRLKELKDEIKSYHETEKKMRLRSQLYKKCGIVFDEDGYLAKDKAVQVEAHTGYGNSAPLTNGSAGSPLGRTAGSPPVTGAPGAGPSPMAALMSVADTLPPGSPRSAGGSPPQAPQQRSNSRSSQHSPNSSGSNGGRRSSGSRHVSSTTSVSSTEAGEGAEAAAPAPAPLLKCTLCQERLEDTHFVQCPSQPHHKFCFPCSRDSIKRQQGSEVYCPSGEKCPLANSTVPWAFMQGEIATILGEEFKPKKERET